MDQESATGTESVNGTAARGGTRISIGGIGGTDGNSSRGSGTPETESVGTQDSPSRFDTSATTFVTSPANRRGRPRKTDTASAKASADMIVGVVETFGRFRYGEDGAMTPQERQMSVNGLTGSFARLPAEVVNQVAALSAPMMAAFGLGMYFARLGSIESRRKASRAEDHRAEQASAILEATRVMQGDNPQPSPNGVPGFGVPSKDELLRIQQEANS